jgi:hypothetical protein
MANEEWMVLGFGHIANREIVYDWSHMKTDCDISSLTEVQQNALQDKYWYHLNNKFFLTRNTTEQTELESELNTLGLSFTTTNVAPTDAQKALIVKHRVARRDRIKEVLETHGPIQSAFNAEVLKGKTPEQIDTYIESNITDLASATEFLKKLSKVVSYMAKHVKLED